MLSCLQQKIDYVALGEVVKEALFTGAVLSFVRPELSGSCVQVFEDNQVAIALAVNPLNYDRSKHIDMRMCCSGGFARCQGFPLRGCRWLLLGPGSC